MPGLINTHTHLYSAFARGMALKDDAPGNFAEILERLWWRLDKALTLDDVYWSAMVGMIDCIRNGVTTIFDHHASPGAVPAACFALPMPRGKPVCAVVFVTKSPTATAPRLPRRESKRIARFFEHCTAIAARTGCAGSSVCMHRSR